MGTDGGFSIYVPARILRIARLYAVMQLLGELPAAIHHDVDGYSLEAFVTSIANPDSSDLLLQFLRDDGWRASNRLPGAMAFQIEINRRWAFFEEVAPLLDFSINADISRLTGTQRVGITTAKQALTELAEEDRESGRKRPRWQNVSVSYATMGRRWKTFKSVSIFSYLYAYQDHPIKPPLLTQKRFAEILLRRTSNGEALKRLVLEYAQVYQLLLARKYQNIPELHITVAEPLPTAGIVMEPLENRIQEALNRHHKGR